MQSMFSPSPMGPPWGLRWRSSVWFVTLVVGFGVATDLFVYAVIIPVVPFRLEALGYSDASARTGWLLFAYSGGLAVSTPPIAWLSERYNSRRTPLLFGLVTLIGAQIMFMLAPVYWLMALARIIQGVSSTFVWTVGLALVCDTVPASRVGQQLGLAMTGLSAGVVLAPPIGGSLFQKLGFHAPFIFSIGIVFIDLIGRLLVIERKAAIIWGVDPAAETRDPGLEQEKASSESLTSRRASLGPPAKPEITAVRRGNPVALADSNGTGPTAEAHESSSEEQVIAPEDAGEGAQDSITSPADTAKRRTPVMFLDLGDRLTIVERGEPVSWGTHEESLKRCFFDPTGQDSEQIGTAQANAGEIMRVNPPSLPGNSDDIAAIGSPSEKLRLTSMQVLSALCLSPRALAAFANTLIYGVTYSSQEPTLPLRLQDAYGFTSLKVGLIYVASSVPTLLSGPLAGWLSDRKGTGLITIFCLLMSIPWFIVMAIHGPLALFIVGVVVSNFFISAVVAPLTAELAAVTRQLPGVGYSHVYGAFNLAYGIGSAIGPLIGGQLYDHITHGWTAVVGLAGGLMLVATTVAFACSGDTTVAKRLVRRRKQATGKSPEVPENEA